MTPRSPQPRRKIARSAVGHDQTWRTSLNLPRDLVREAQSILGTRTITSTVVRSMEEAVRLRLRLRLLQRDFPDLTLEAIEEMRRRRLQEGGELRRPKRH